MKYLIVHMAEAEDHEAADKLANSLRLPFTKDKDQPQLAMVAQIDDPDNDIEVAMAFLPDDAALIDEGSTYVIDTQVTRSE